MKTTTVSIHDVDSLKMERRDLGDGNAPFFTQYELHVRTIGVMPDDEPNITLRLFTKLGKDLYTSLHGEPESNLCCPFCESEEISGDSIVIVDQEAHQKMGCYQCGGSWADRYDMKRRVDLEHGDEKCPAVTAARRLAK